MQIKVRLDCGEGIVGDEESFQVAIGELLTNDLVLDTPLELVTKMIDTLNDFLLVLQNGIRQMGALQIKVDGVQTYLNTERVTLIQVTGVEEFLRDAIEYGDSLEQEQD